MSDHYRSIADQIYVAHKTLPAVAIPETRTWPVAPPTPKGRLTAENGQGSPTVNYIAIDPLFKATALVPPGGLGLRRFYKSEPKRLIEMARNGADIRCLRYCRQR